MLSITDISIRIAGRLLIDDSSVQIVPGARVGFVGHNGVGKSTLFHAIRGDLPIESGSINLPPRWRIGSLAQEVRRAREQLGVAVLVAEQNVAYARQCTEYVYLLDSGKLVFEGDWAAFDAKPELKTRYLAV